MTAKIIDGVAIARSVRVGIAERAGALKARGVNPALTVILVGDDPASAIYVRNKVRASGRMRLTVCRSNRQISAQIIDDAAGRTLVSASSLEKVLGGAGSVHGNKAAAEKVGKALGERALAAGIKQVAFDRGSYKFHGRVAALADAARSAGLEF